MAVRQIKAENTSMVFGRGPDITDRKELVKKANGKIREYLVTSWEHDEDSDLLENQALSPGRAGVSDEINFLWGSGPFSVQVPSEDGYLDLTQALLNDPNPISTPIPKKTLVVAKTNVSDIVAATYFTDTMDATIKAIDDQDLKDTSVDVVKAQNLSGAGDKTIANNLSSYADALTLTVTPSGSADLTTSSTPGTVVITYTTAAGQTRTFTLSFANAVKTDAQTRDLPAGATITRVRSTGWSTGTFDITTAVSDKTIANDLSDYADALTLTVAPGSAAALTNTGTPGTVVITYTDADGEIQTLSLSFPDSAKTAAQMAALPAGATITRVRATGWSAGKFDITTALAGNIVRNPDPDRPGQLRVKYTGALTGHKMLIRGVRRVGLASSDTLPMRDEIELGADVLTDKYFHKINKVEVKDATGAIVAAPAGTIEIIAEPGGFETKLKVVNDDPEGLTFEADVGGEPRVVNRGIVIGGEIEIGDTIGATYNLLSNRVDKRQTIEERDDPQFTSMMQQDREDHSRLADRDFERVTSRFYSGHGRFLELDGEAVICNSVGLNIEHNYDFVQGKVPGMFRRDTDANARRLTTASVNTNYESGSSEEDTFIRWDEKYRNREKVNARVGTYQWRGDGRQLSVTYRMKNCDIQSPVRVPATGPGVVPVTVELKALPLDGQTDGEIEVIIVSDDRWV
ncbi:hypothetical protein C6503_19060 [Candidatus Poribacteria bacterium]|nr:MAG: hypothetical protein C6503_19060 [Candidatus Poribacteria bacterium]